MKLTAKDILIWFLITIAGSLVSYSVGKFLDEMDFNKWHK